MGGRFSGGIDGGVHIDKCNMSSACANKADPRAIKFVNDIETGMGAIIQHNKPFVKESPYLG